MEGAGAEGGKRAPVVQSAARAVRILRILFYSVEGKSLQELSDELGLHKATTRRLLQTLMAEGVVRRDAATRRHYFEPVVALQALAAFRHLASAAAISQQVLDDLAEATGGTAMVICPDETGRQVMACMWALPQQAVRLDPSAAGQRAPMHAVAAGKCYLAGLSRDELTEWMKGELPRATEHTMVSREELRRELAAVRKQGYALNRGETIAGTPGMAVPLRDATGKVAGGLSLAVVGHEMTEEMVRDWLPLLGRGAETISAFMYGDLKRNQSLCGRLGRR